MVCQYCSWVIHLWSSGIHLLPPLLQRCRVSISLLILDTFSSIILNRQTGTTSKLKKGPILWLWLPNEGNPHSKWTLVRHYSSEINVPKCGQKQLMNVKLSFNIFIEIGDVYITWVYLKTLLVDLYKNNMRAIWDIYNGWN